ncbi:MAG: YiiX/YebB-like N1pC/P60 family cysteine hydrolase [Bacteroidales bacterium]|nr:YiiX/YebB-like N1pC/P60 family cysteine hydrolase [Bacteroidales bacterium]
MKRLLFLYFIVVFIVGCGLDQKSSYPIPENLLQDGDLVFRCGISVSSYAVRVADKIGSYSHVGMVVKETDGWHVIHIVNGEMEDTDGKEIIKNEPISRFFRKDRARAGIVLRYDAPDSVLHQVVERAKTLSQQEIYFDAYYSLSDSTKLYCTELIYNIFQNAQIDISEGRRSRCPTVKEEVILPSDIFKNQKLREIYHFSE